MKQVEYRGENSRENLVQILKQERSKKPFFVIGKAFYHCGLDKEVETAFPNAIYFRNFTSNPVYESVASGVNLFREQQCDFIVAVGGGSAIDVAKCIKGFASMEEGTFYLAQKIKQNGIKMLAMPTTAGTGSEATPFAVIYYKGIKQSIEHSSLLPDYVILDGAVLATLPFYQKKATLLDALCHAIESVWSIDSTQESIELASEAIQCIVLRKEAYLNNIELENCQILYAVNLAGKAIGITHTTAAHAMSYILTSRYGIAHGHAAALCLPGVWEYSLKHMDNCVDVRGRDYLNSIFAYLSNLFGKENSWEAIKYLKYLIWNELEMSGPIITSDAELSIMADSVNHERLYNHPVLLNKDALIEIYKGIVTM